MKLKGFFMEFFYMETGLCSRNRSARLGLAKIGFTIASFMPDAIMRNHFIPINSYWQAFV